MRPAEIRESVQGQQAARTAEAPPEVESTEQAGRRARLVSAVLAGDMTQAEAARKEKVSPKTIGRWVKAAREAQDTKTAVNG